MSSSNSQAKDVKSQKAKIDVLEAELESLHHMICCNSNNHLHDNSTLETKVGIFNSELAELYHDKTRGAMIRPRARRIEQGEKPTKYFLNLENRIARKRPIDG